jgi:hypothetical protein
LYFGIEKFIFSQFKLATRKHQEEQRLLQLKNTLLPSLIFAERRRNDFHLEFNLAPLGQM